MARSRDKAGGSARRSGMSDVAALAGVSLGTVSNVLNHPERVSEVTKDKVERAIRVLNFTPHGLARSLAVGSMSAVGLVVSDLKNSLFVDIARGVERAAEEQSVFVLVANSDSALEREREYLRMFSTMQVLGSLITLNEERHYLEILETLDLSGPPVVMLNYSPAYATHCSVHIDNRLGGRIAAEHLLDIGRRKLAFVGGPEQLQPVVARREGFFQVLQERGVSVVAEEYPDEVNRSDGWAVGHRLLPRIERGEIDAIFAVTDLLAAGIAQAIGAGSSLRIPEDLAVVGYDDNREAWDSPMPLTTIRQPGEEMGYEGAKLIFDELRSPGHTHRALDLSPELVVRRSTVVGAP